MNIYVSGFVQNFRMESISIKHVHGIAKVLGSVIGVSGVLVIAFVKGPPIKFMNWHPANDHGQIQDSSKTCCSREEWIKGTLLMISANTLWSLWLVLQVNSCSSNFFSNNDFALVSSLFSSSSCVFFSGMYILLCCNFWCYGH